MTHDTLRYLCAALSAVGAVAQLYGMWLYPAAFGKTKPPRKRKVKRKRGASLRHAHHLIDAGSVVMFVALMIFTLVVEKNEISNLYCITGFLVVIYGWLVADIVTERKKPGGAEALTGYAAVIFFGILPLTGQMQSVWLSNGFLGGAMVTALALGRRARVKVLGTDKG